MRHKRIENMSEHIKRLFKEVLWTHNNSNAFFLKLYQNPTVIANPMYSSWDWEDYCFICKNELCCLFSASIEHCLCSLKIDKAKVLWSNIILLSFLLAAVYIQTYHVTCYLLVKCSLAYLIMKVGCDYQWAFLSHPQCWSPSSVTTIRSWNEELLKHRTLSALSVKYVEKDSRDKRCVGGGGEGGRERASVWLPTSFYHTLRPPLSLFWLNLARSVGRIVL